MKHEDMKHEEASGVSSCFMSSCFSYRMSRRTEMVGSTIQKELAQIIMRELNDPRLMGMPSITHVKVSADLAIADVYVTVMGTPVQETAALNALKHSAGMMRARLTKEMTLRQAP